MFIHKGDTVIVRSGKERGAKGKVLKVFPREGRLVVEGVHMMKRHQRARRSNEKGQILEKPMPLFASMVSLVDPDTGKGTRVGKRKVGERFVRFAKKSGREV